MFFPSIKSLKKADFIFIFLFSLASIYIYVGFYFPSSYTLSYGSNPKKILLAIRILFPLIYFALLWLYMNVRSRRIEKSAAIILIVSSVISLFICYSVADIFYQQWFDKYRKEYHPYLQLKPIDYKPKQKKISNALKIFCLGGSTTELPDKSGIDWPSRVETILRTKYNLKNIEVYNLGRQWYTSLHTLINYETNFRQYKPSVLLIMQSVNDLLHNADFSYFSRGHFRDDYGHFYGPVNRIIDRRSLWRYLSEIISGLWYSKPQHIINTDRLPGLKAYTNNLNTIIELAENDSTQIVLMTEPSLLKSNMTADEISAVGMLKVEAINDTMVWGIETVRNGMEQYNNALKKIARQHNLFLIDLDKEIPKSLEYFYDEVHYNDITFPIIAQFVAKELNNFLEEDGIE